MMKKYKLRILVITTILFGSFGLTFFSNTLLNCDVTRYICYRVDGTMIVDDQSLVVAVENQEQREWLLETIAPYLEGSTAEVSVIVRETTSAFAFANSTIDVAMLDKQAAGTVFPLLHRFDIDEVNAYALDFAQAHLTDINYDGVAFIPMIIDGPFFVMNTTILEQLGFDITDVDEYGRLNQLSSFEAIMAASDRFRDARPLINNRRLTSMFPLTVVEPWSVYAFLTANGWRMYPNNDAFDPGFDTPEFLEALELIETLLAHEWDLSGRGQKHWRYESEFMNTTTPFSLKVPWLNLEAITKATRHHFVVTPLPTIGGMQPYSLAQVSGWVFKSTASPALRQLVLEKLTSNSFKQLLLNQDVGTVIIDPNQRDQFEISDLQLQKMMASRFSVSPPILALPQDHSVLGFDFYADGDMLTYLKQLQTQTITPLQAQAQIVQAFNRWTIKRTYYENRTNP